MTAPALTLLAALASSPAGDTIELRWDAPPSCPEHALLVAPLVDPIAVSARISALEVDPSTATSSAASLSASKVVGSATAQPV